VIEIHVVALHARGAGGRRKRERWTQRDDADRERGAKQGAQRGERDHGALPGSFESAKTSAVMRGTRALPAGVLPPANRTVPSPMPAAARPPRASRSVRTTPATDPGATRNGSSS